MSHARAILDTSVFIARERRRELALDRFPDEGAISVVTLAELGLGVHMARSGDERTARLRTLRTSEATYVALPVDRAVAEEFAALVAAARRKGRRPKVQDAWIAATARAHGAPVVTQDAGFDGLPGVEVVRV